MKASDFSKQLRDEVNGLIANGQKNIACRALVRALEKNIPKLEEAEQKTRQVPLDFQLAHYEAQIAAKSQMFASVLDYGKHALNAAMIINAGAAVALLTLIGGLFAHSSQLAVNYASPLLLFVVGVLAAAMAYGGAYCAQYFYTENSESKIGKSFHTLTVLFAIGSYALFLSGAISCYLILTSKF